MHVLMISDVCFPRVNGVSTSIETFQAALPRLGIHVSLIGPHYSACDAKPARTFRVSGRPVPGDAEDRLMSFRRCVEAAHAVDAVDPVDLVHIQTPFVAHYAGLRFARKVGVPALATYHTLFEEYAGHYFPVIPQRWSRGLARRVSRTQCNALDKVIVPSTAMFERLRDYAVTAPIEVLPTGIPLLRFAEGNGAAFRSRHGISPKQALAVFVGRVAHEKNIGFLIDVATHARRHVADFMLAIVGEGPARPSLEQRVREAGLGENVRFIGYLDRTHELPNCYAAADAFVFASRTETQGLVLLEAMAMGVPVVSLAEMGTRDILAAGRGCIVPPDNAEKFADELAMLLCNHRLRTTMAAEARLYAAEWSDGVMAARLAALYRTFAGRVRRPAATLRSKAETP